MQPQRLALLIVIILGALELIGNAMSRRPPAELKILIKAQKSPQLAEGLVRYLSWDLALRRGFSIGIGLVVDDPDDEIKMIQSILMEEGLLKTADDLEPDLVFVI